MGSSPGRLRILTPELYIHYIQKMGMSSRGERVQSSGVGSSGERPTALLPGREEPWVPGMPAPAVAAGTSAAGPGSAGSRRSRLAAAGWGAAGVAATLVLLQVLSVTGAVPTHDIPRMTAILASLGHQARAGAFWAVVGDTLEGWGIGLALAVVVGLPLGMVIGVNRLVWRALRPTIEFLRPVPSVALIPLAILLYGNGLKSTALMTAFGAVWPLLIQTTYGARELDAVARDTARSFRISTLRRIIAVRLPSALPFIATGLRVASATALIVAITSELIISSPGLGNAILFAESGGQYTSMYALILAAGLLGLALNTVFTQFERYFLRWHPSQRTEI
jgi:ABC-type nitrate/sulfonate/bicarbonate transport system permease component